MNYKLAHICIILSALSAITIAGIYAYKTFYYDPINEWKLISDAKNHVYIVKNRGEIFVIILVKKLSIMLELQVNGLKLNVIITSNE